MSTPLETKLTEHAAAGVNTRVQTELKCLNAIVARLKEKNCDYCGAPGCVRKYCHPYKSIKRTCRGDKQR